MDYTEWKAAVTKKLEDPRAANVREKVWRDAYIKRLSPEQGAVEIDRHYYNSLSPKDRARRNRSG